MIHARIHPRIDGVRIRPVELTTRSPGRVAYVVHVPQSFRAPRQAADKRYYERFNFESVPMEDYEVRDVARRASRPILELRVRDTRSGFVQQGFEADLQFQADNISEVTASFVVVTLGWPQHVITSTNFATPTDWKWFEHAHEWSVARCVVASGRSGWWSPVTPGFTLILPPVVIRFPVREAEVEGARVIALARLDHDGGSSVYQMEFWRHGDLGERIRLRPGREYVASRRERGAYVPAVFALNDPNV